MACFRKDSHEPDIWPGFVDALSTVLMVFIFVLVGFISSQVYLSGVILDKDTALSSAQSKLTRACLLLEAEKDKASSLACANTEMTQKIAELSRSVSDLETMLGHEKEQHTKAEIEKQTLEQKIEGLTGKLEEVMATLAREHTALEDAKKKNVKLGELSRLVAFRSEFFDKLQNIVKDKENIKIAGDRFIFQSELFFDTASDELSEDGRQQLSGLASVIKDIARKIPREVRWILRVDGHTDKRPIAIGRFQSNWELSAARAISVVRYLIGEGIPPERLVAAGFGEHQPLDSGMSEENLSRNRRIEFKLDER